VEALRLGPTRRELLAALAGLPLAACARARSVLAPPGVIAGGNATLGHRLRTGELLARPPVRTERIGTAILGAGVSGLSVAWTMARAGDLDFRLLELEREPGGTARSGGNAVSLYPWGAHYVPVPVSPNPALEALLAEVGALTGRGPDGQPQWAEEMLCREPEERLFLGGLWYEGLYPRAGASRDDLAQLARFEETMRAFAARVDSRGRRAFALPRRLSSEDGDLTALDRLSFADWLRSERLTSARLHWFVEYGCRDDFGGTLAETSAWAGIHYYAARLPGHAKSETAAPFLTWPEGNGRLVAQLARAAQGKVTSGALVFDVRPAATGVEVRYLDAARDEVVLLQAEHAVFALPKYLAGRVVAPWREGAPAHLAAFSYVPWLVANLTLKDRPPERGYPLSWDNVIHGSASLGYVVATHQKGRDRGPTVFTYYRPFAGEEPGAARQRLLSASHAELSAAVMAELGRAHPELPSLVTRLDVYRWGHAMARPVPGFLWSAALVKAREPLGRLRFAHADLSGLPLFEEAQDAGVRAAEDILREKRVRFAPLT